jgi:hypothetical protein
VRRLTLLSLASLALLLGCASTPAPAPPAPTSADLPPPGTEAPVAAPKRAIPQGQIRREDVLALIGDGPPAFLQRVEVEPAVEPDGRFRGWRVVAIRDQDLAAGDVKPGDVITRVNGQPIENPIQFFDVFQSLAFAPELRLSVDRAGGPQELRYAINDDPSAPPLPRPVQPARAANDAPAPKAKKARK